MKKQLKIASKNNVNWVNFAKFSHLSLKTSHFPSIENEKKIDISQMVSRFVLRSYYF